MIFRVRPKKMQICLVTRMASQKNVHEFMRIAQRVPRYKFILVGAEADKDRDYTQRDPLDRKSTRLNSSHRCISYAVFCLKKKKDDLITLTAASVNTYNEDA